MKKFKSGIAVLLIITVTSVMVLLPKALNNYDENRMLNRTVYWRYDDSTGIQLTRHTVAELFSNADTTTMSYGNSIIINSREYIQKEINTDIDYMFDDVFSENNEVLNYVKDIIGDEIPTCAKQHLLTVINDRPVVLNLVNVSYKDAFGVLDFTYEEKTKTLISFCYCIFSIEAVTNKFDSVLSAKAMQETINNYYKEKLELSDDSFFFRNYFIETDFAIENIIEFAITSKEYNFESEYTKEIQY